MWAFLFVFISVALNNTGANSPSCYDALQYFIIKFYVYPCLFESSYRPIMKLWQLVSSRVDLLTSRFLLLACFDCFNPLRSTDFFKVFAVVPFPVWACEDLAKNLRSQ